MDDLDTCVPLVFLGNDELGIQMFMSSASCILLAHQLTSVPSVYILSMRSSLDDVALTVPFPMIF